MRRDSKTEQEYEFRNERSSGRENLYTERRREELARSGRTQEQRAARKRGSDAAPVSSPEERQPSRTYKDEKRDYKKSLKEHRYGEEEGFREAAFPNKIKRPEKAEKPVKKKGKGGRAFLAIVLIIVVAICVIFAVPSTRGPAFKVLLKSPLGGIAGEIFFGNNYRTYVLDKDFDDSKIKIHDGVKTPAGNQTIALFGVDARMEEVGAGVMADSMIVVNINPEGEIKMASVFRDTYLMSRTKDAEEIISKANSAYFRGGPLGAVNMLNENFDLAITDYVVVNFWGLADIIDELGGIRLTVTEEEKEELNYHLKGQNYYFGNMEYKPLEKSGESILLTGDQATSFCRIRKVTFHSPEDGETYRDDYGRTARQRYVLKELISQTKEKGMISLMQNANKIFAANSKDQKCIQSSMSIGELVRFFGMGYDMNLAGSAGFPELDHQYNAVLDSGDSVVADTLEDAVIAMHRFLYGTENYEPTGELRQVAEQIRAEVFRQIGR